jgi:nicotinate-nucleotide pyrophosphorylase (carboxylating)
MHKNSFLEQYKSEIDSFISAALKEDIGDGDHTSQSCLSNSETSKANLLGERTGYYCGS